MGTFYQFKWSVEVLLFFTFFIFSMYSPVIIIIFIYIQNHITTFYNFFFNAQT